MILLRERVRVMILNNLGTKLVSVVIAFVLWGIVLGSRNVEVTKEVPLEILTSPELVVGNEIPDKLAYRLSGPKAFLRTILDRHQDPIRVDLTASKAGNINYRFFSDNIRVPIGVKVLSISPASVLIKLEPVKKREVPITAELRGAPPEGFRLGKVEIRPNVVRIKGAESKIESLTGISTSPIDLSMLRQPLEREVPIDLARQNLAIEGALPRIYIEIETIGANFRIKNVDIRVLTSYKFTLQEKNVVITVRARAKDLKGIDKSQVFAVVDLRGKPKGHYLEAVKVTLPEDVTLVKVMPEKVNVDLN